MSTTRAEFLSAKEMATILGLEANLFKRMVAQGDIPQGIAITGKKLKMWPAEDVAGIAWLLKNRIRMRKSTPDEEENDSE